MCPSLPVEKALKLIADTPDAACYIVILNKDEQPVATIEMMFSHIDQNMAGLKFPEFNFVFNSQKSTQLNRVTVYRTLKLLKEGGLVDELDLMHYGGDQHYYETRLKQASRLGYGPLLHSGTCKTLDDLRRGHDKTQELTKDYTDRLDKILVEFQPARNGSRKLGDFDRIAAASLGGVPPPARP